jgi:Predicted hydrolases or acyltransferases (alpha/beta hydrolase superfamily)
METVSHGFATVNGVRLHYAASGTGDLVVLLHGFPEFWYSWRHQLKALAPHFHVVAPDLRGYNLSDKPTKVEDYRLEVLAEDIIGLINHFGGIQAAIVGHDRGGALAWMLAQKFADRVSKVVVMQTPPAAAWRANFSVGQLLRSWYMFFFQLPRIPEWLISRNNFATLDELFKEGVVRPGTFSEADIAVYREAIQKPKAITAALNYYRANVMRLMGRASASTEVKAVQDNRIRVPTLFIFGEQDVAILPKTVEGLERFMNAPYRELRIPDAGHWVQNEAPDEVNTALLDFLKNQDLSA